MYTRGKARREASAHASGTEDEYTDALDAELVRSPSSRVHNTYQPRADRTNSAEEHQLFEVGGQDSSTEHDTDNITMMKGLITPPRLRRRQNSRRGSTARRHYTEREAQGDNMPNDDQAGMMNTMKSFMDTFTSTMKAMQNMIDTTVQTIRSHVKPSESAGQGKITPSATQITTNLSRETATAQEEITPASEEHHPKMRRKIARPNLTSRRIIDFSSSSSDSEPEHNLSSSSIATSRIFKRKSSDDTASKLPAYTGKETWRVWYTRFESVALLSHWTEREKLKQMLPRIQGTAAEFVYGQLKSTVLTEYKQLVKELEGRFGIVETCKTYKTKFNRRMQLKGESPEDFAAELKRLYDKAHPTRNAETKQEDLVSHFLIGLQNEQARIHVELNKDPKTIEEAVLHVVNFNETTNYTRAHYDQNSDRYPNQRRPARQVKKSISQNKPGGPRNEPQKVEVSKQGPATKTYNKDKGKKYDNWVTQRDGEEKLCFKCHQPGHFIANCPGTTEESPIDETSVKAQLNTKAKEFNMKSGPSNQQNQNAAVQLNNMGSTQ